MKENKLNQKLQHTFILNIIFVVSYRKVIVDPARWQIVDLESFYLCEQKTNIDLRNKETLSKY
jgi:hypothetical protein